MRGGFTGYRILGLREIVRVSRFGEKRFRWCRIWGFRGLGSVVLGIRGDPGL